MLHHILRTKKSLILLTLISVAVLAMPTPSYSQGAIASIRLTSVDYSAFPQVKVNAVILDTSGKFLNNLPDGSLAMTENGEAVTFEHRPTEVGVEVALVADVGAGNSSSGATGASRLVEIRDLISRYIEGMGANDRATVVLVNENGVSVLQPLTGDKTALAATINSISANPGSTVLTNGLGGVKRGLDDLKELGDASRFKAVVLFSSGVQTSTPVNYGQVESYATQLNIPVHTVLTNSSYDGGSLAGLARRTNGEAITYKGQSDADSLYQTLQQQRIQYEFVYRSHLNTSSERTIEVAVDSSSAVPAKGSIRFVVPLQPPSIIIKQPVPGAEILRETDTPGINMDAVEPTATNVVADVVWPDGLPRTIVSAQLLVNGSPSGTPVNNPGNSLSLPWDLRSYRTGGQNAVQLQIQVQDEVGFTAISAPQAATVTVGLSLSCVNVTGIGNIIFCAVSRYSGIIALLVAVPTLIIVYLNRGRVVEIGRQAGENVSTFVQRFTKPLSTRTTAAYLVVIRGDSFLTGRRISVAADTVTPLGCDKQRAEIVFSDDNPIVSGKHCEISIDGSLYRIKDFGSVNGTYLNGVRLPELEEEEIHHLDQIELGPAEAGGVVLRFEVASESFDDELRKTRPAAE